MVSEICIIDNVYYKQDYCVIECSNKNVLYKVKCDIGKYDSKYILFFGEIIKCVNNIIYVEAYEVKKVNRHSDIKIVPTI